MNIHRNNKENDGFVLAGSGPPTNGGGDTRTMIQVQIMGVLISARGHRPGKGGIANVYPLNNTY